MIRRHLAAVLLLLGASPVHAVTRTVPLQAATIQSAIGLSVHGDSVLVAAGTYHEHLDFMGKAIYVGSLSGRDSTFIERVYNEVPIVRFVSGEGRSSVLDGCAIRKAVDGFGIYCDASSPTIQHCDISHCQESGRNGNAIVCQNSAALIQYNRVHHNSATTGGAIYIKGTCVFGSDSLTVAYNDIFNNWNPGVECRSADGATVHHNLLRANLNSSIAVISSRARIYNNTVVESSYGIIANHGPTGDIRNNIVMEQQNAGLTPAANTFDYNDVWNVGSGNDPGLNGISADPMFVDPAAGDYRLAPGSPCIDTGDPNPVYDDSDGTRANIGAGLTSDMVSKPFAVCSLATFTGDANQNSRLTSADIIYLVNYIFKNGSPPIACEAIGDVNCDGAVTSADIIRLVNYIFGAAASGIAFKGGDPLCNVCPLVLWGTWDCP